MQTKLENRIQALDQQRCQLLDEVEALDVEQLRAKPLPEKWSILEIVEHLVVAEREILQGLPQPSQLVQRRRSLKSRLLFLVVMFILRYKIPVKVPSRRMIPTGTRSLAELRALWDENQQWLRAYVDELDAPGLRSAVFEHPVAGPMNVAHAVHMGRLHLDTHRQQIGRLQRLTSRA